MKRRFLRASFCSFIAGDFSPTATATESEVADVDSARRSLKRAARL
jgi:hypothetical protein